MPAPTTTYASDQVNVVIQGNTIVGFMPDSVVKVGRDEDAFKKIVGADGTVSRARNANRAGFIEITLQQTSPSNDVLSALAQLDELTANAIGTGLVKDLSGRTLHATNSCWVKKQPENEFGAEVKGRTWVIDTGALNMNTAGN